MTGQSKPRAFPSMKSLAALWLLVAVLAVAGRLAGIAAAGEASVFRWEAGLTEIRPEQGLAFVATTGNVALSSHRQPSQARVLEDGRPLGPANALHDAIRKTGRGQYSFWHDYVYFTASDNSDPRTNGRTYTVDAPVVPAAAAALLGRGALVALVLALAATLIVVSRPIWRAAVPLAREVPPLIRAAGGVVRSVAALWVLAGVLGVAASAGFLVRSGVVTWVWPQIEIGAFGHEQGTAYVAALGRSDLSSHAAPSAARVLEDGRPLGPGNVQHGEIREQGRGRFSFWHDYVLFSASDGSDPRSNGRRYTVSYPPVSDAVAEVLYLGAALAIAGAIAAALWALSLRRAALVRTAGAGIALAGRAVAEGSAWANGRLLRRRLTPNWRGPAGIGLVVLLWAALAALLAADREVYLARTGQSTWLWTSAPLQGFVPELGHAYVAGTQRSDLSSHAEASIARILEDGRPLGPGNAQHIDIRDGGTGRYSFWHDYVLFATSDNSDPRTNGRTYTITYPEIGPAEAALLLGLTLLAGLAALISTAMLLRARAFGDRPVRVLKEIWARRAPVLVAASGGALIVIPLMRAAQATPGLVTLTWLGVFALTLAASRVVLRGGGRPIPMSAALALLAALGAGEAVMTIEAPHKWQGCHTTDPVPVWDGFCVSPDSASYYLGYQPGSTRNPMYPWFISVLTAGTDFEPSAYRNQARNGALITNQSDPLFRVVKAQVVLLLLASIVLAAALMVVLRSLLPPAIVLALYDYGYFTAYELNTVLTEPLVQTGLFLIVAAFLLFLWRPRPALLIGAAACCGLVYLTRQAGAYMALFVGVMMLAGLAQDWRRWWKPAGAAVAVLVGLVLIPDLYTYSATGSLTRTQEGIQYQYRIAHAMQYATPADLALMPDEGTRQWLANAITLRDREHRMVDEKFTTQYDRMTYYINQNLYAVAMPTSDRLWVEKLPMAAGNYTRVSEFYMAVATPILARHWREYAQFAFTFWRLGLTYPPVSRVRLGPLGPWAIYAILAALILMFRDRTVLAAATLIAAHWGHVAIASLFAVPIPRMVWASELLVALAAMLLLWRVAAAVSASSRAPREAAPVGAEEVLA